MSAKITVIVYILICLEVGVLLAILPWTPYWNDNLFLYFISNALHAPWLTSALQSGYTRGAVTGLGALNILAGLRDAFKFRESVQTLTDWESPAESQPTAPTVLQTAESSVTTSTDLPDHQSPRVPPAS
ncbi:MAG TPA: hypothetical protein VFD58_12860 [Blastocatellia bacterium]|nr:hypothetical protein [Blastocatellia bacterium]